MRSVYLRTLAALLALVGMPGLAVAACCYFAAKDKDILQPGQKAFLTFDAAAKVEIFSVQSKFEGNAVDFGMVIPTPAKPKLDEMPRDFFKDLAIYSILKKREQPQSKLLPRPERQFAGRGGANREVDSLTKDGRKSTVKVLEEGVVGS